MKLKALSQIRHDGKVYEAGDTLDVSKDVATPLIEAGVVSTGKGPVSNTDSEPTGANTEPTNPPAGNGDADVNAENGSEGPKDNAPFDPTTVEGNVNKDDYTANELRAIADVRGVDYTANDNKEVLASKING